MSQLTFGDIKILVAEYAGKGGVCEDSPLATSFAWQVLEYLLIAGTYGSIRKFDFVVQDRFFTAPPELETPLKVKVNGQVGTVLSKWFDFRMSNGELEGGLDAGKALLEEANPVFTAFPLVPGYRLGVLGTAAEDPEAFIIVQGTDILGTDIITSFEGEQVRGIKFRIKKGELRTTEVAIANITGIIKSKTKGYVQLYSYEKHVNQREFLGHYSPLEEKPSYKQFRIGVPCPSRAYVSVLARIRLRENYTDNDIVPFDNRNIIKMAAQHLQAESNNDISVANYKSGQVNTMINNHAGHKSTNTGTPIEIYRPRSGAAIKNII